MKGKCCATCKTDSCPAHVVAAAEAANSNLPEEVAPGGAVGASARMKCQAFKKQGMCADSRVRGFCCVSCGDESCSVRKKRKKNLPKLWEIARAHVRLHHILHLCMLLRPVPCIHSRTHVLFPLPTSLLIHLQPSIHARTCCRHVHLFHPLTDASHMQTHALRQCHARCRCHTSSSATTRWAFATCSHQRAHARTTQCFVSLASASRPATFTASTNQTTSCACLTYFRRATQRSPNGFDTRATTSSGSSCLTFLALFRLRSSMTCTLPHHHV